MTDTDLRQRLKAALGDAYHIERELPAGGMSRLFLATERSLDRHVVIKLLPPELASEVSAARFQREVTLTAHLQHPHILPILAGGSREGLLYYVMPYVDGESLRHRLDREAKLPVASAVRILEEVADALARAHEAGVVHRDIKPENILLQRDHALLADFGVARALHEATGGQRLTNTGSGLGTPGYMAPEQLAGDQNVDARADVYALAVVGYEMLTGTPPFTGATPQAVAAAHFTTAPKPVTQRRPDVPPSVSRAIGKALATEPTQRFATAADFRDALTAPRSSLPPRRAIGRRWAIAAAAVVLLAAGALFGWRSLHSGGSASASGPIRLAVLPFDNLGDSADAYFADGVTDAIRAKLTSIPNLEVIAPASSDQYRKSKKTPQQIGAELGVRYLVVGRVRWAKTPGTPGRVEVSPALVEASTAADKWEQPFDAALDDVFRVQGEIATHVAAALDVALGARAHQALVARPTQSLPAYDAYLRGRAISHDLETNDSPTLARAAAAFSEAVRLDSAFALAWAARAITYARLSANTTPDQQTGELARQSSERARALDPALPDTYLALADYHLLVSQDFARALQFAVAGSQLVPGDARLVAAAAAAENHLGRWSASLADNERAAQLDPRSTLILNALGEIHLALHHFPDARAVLDRALAIDPTDLATIEKRVRLSLAEGDSAGARAVLRAVPASIDRGELAAVVTNFYNLYWVLDEADQRRLLAATPAAFGWDTASWALTRAEVYALRGDSGKARIYADSARVAYEAVFRPARSLPVGVEAYNRALLGDALALLDRRAAATHEAWRAAQLNAVAADAADGPLAQYETVWLDLILGEREGAIDGLERLLAVPTWITPAGLRIDPTYAQLHGNPRFERLIAPGASRP